VWSWCCVYEFPKSIRLCFSLQKLWSAGITGSGFRHTWGNVTNVSKLVIHFQFCVMFYLGFPWEVIFVNDLPGWTYPIHNPIHSVWVRSDLIVTLRSYKQILTMPSIGASHQNCFPIAPNLFIFTFGQKIQLSIYYIMSMDTQFNVSLQYKDLGVIFTSDFNWTAHYTSISAKASKLLVHSEEPLKPTVQKQRKICILHW